MESWKSSPYFVVHHSETWDDEHCEVFGEQTWPLCRVTSTRIRPDNVFYGVKRKDHIGGTYMERLEKGDRVAIAQDGDHAFVYPAYGGSVLTFRGELIAVASMDA